MTQSIGPNGSAGWNVTGVQETTTANPGGGFITGKRVSFRTGLGNQGTVFISDAQFTPQSVAAAVAMAAQLLDSVATLAAPPA